MKKTLLLAGVASLFAMNANAVEFNPYVSAKLRYTDMSSDITLADTFTIEDNVMGGSVAIGTSVKTSNGNVRAELEYNKNQNAEKSFAMNFAGVVDFQGNLEVETQSVMLNGYYDIDTGSKLTPYVGAGIGLAKTEATLTGLGYSQSVDDNTFAWQVGAGVGYNVTEKITVDAGYRYVDYGNFSNSDYDVDVETSAHELYLGARYTF